MIPLFITEVEFQPLVAPFRVVEVQGGITWKLKSAEGSVRPGDTLVAGMTIYLEPRSVVTCGDRSGSAVRFSAEESQRAISFFGLDEAASRSDSERMVPMVREVYENMAMVEAANPDHARFAMAHIVSRPSVQALAADFDPNALALLNHTDRTQLKVLPIREPDSNTLLVASDEWTPAKALKVMTSTNRRLSLALLNNCPIRGTQTPDRRGLGRARTRA